jgi:predicted transcriptional regulator
MGLDTTYAMGKRKMYNTTLDSDLIRQVKILAAQLEKRQNDLLEEAIKDLLKKYNLDINGESFSPPL